MILAVSDKGALNVVSVDDTGSVTTVATPDTERLRGEEVVVHDSKTAVTLPDGALWDFSNPATPRMLAELPALMKDPAQSTAVFSLDGRTLTLYAGSLRYGHTAAKYDLADPLNPRLVGTVDNVRFPVSVTRDGRTMATDDSGVVMLYDITDTLRPRWIGGKEETRGGGLRILIGPDGTYFVTGADDSVVRTWRVAQDHKVTLAARLYGHTNVVRGMTVNAAGTLLVTGSVDQTAIVWDISDPSQPEELARINNGSEVGHVQFRGEGGRLLVSGPDAPPSVWDISALTAIHADPVGRACPLLGPPFSAEEKQRYLGDTEPIDVCR